MERLIVALGDAGRARAAASVLARIGDARAVEALVAQLEDPSLPGHRPAVRELDRIGDARAVPALTIPILIDDLDGDPLDRQEARERLSSMGSAAVEPLIATLDDAKRAPSAADALGRIDDRRAVEPLIAMLHDAMLDNQGASAWAADAAVEALGRIGDARAVEPLIATLGLSERYDDARAKAADALGSLGDARAVEALVAAACKTSSSERVKSHALGALGEIRDERAVEALIAAIRSGGLTVPVYARRALEKSMTEAEISRRVSASPPRDAANEGWVPILKRDIMQFLDSPRTRERERQGGDWWSHDDLKLVATKNYSSDLPPDVLFATADRAVRELEQEGRLVGTASGYRAK